MTIYLACISREVADRFPPIKHFIENGLARIAARPWDEFQRINPGQVIGGYLDGPHPLTVVQHGENRMQFVRDELTGPDGETNIKSTIIQKPGEEIVHQIHMTGQDINGVRGEIFYSSTPATADSTPILQIIPPPSEPLTDTLQGKLLEILMAFAAEPETFLKKRISLRTFDIWGQFR